jgi:hypothetical protein
MCPRNRIKPTRIKAAALDLTYGDYDGVGNVGSIVDSQADRSQTFI